MMTLPAYWVHAQAESEKLIFVSKVSSPVIVCGRFSGELAFKKNQI